MEIENNLRDAISELLKKYPDHKETPLYRIISQCLRDHSDDGTQNIFLNSQKKLFGTIQDVSNQMSMLHALEESEKFYRTILSNIWDAIFLTDNKGALTFVCSNTKYIFGYNEDEIYSQGNIFNILNIQLSKIDEKNLEDLHNTETRIKDKSGRFHHLLVSVKKVDIRNSKFLITCKDISELKIIQYELKRNEERFRTYFKEDANIKLLIDANSGQIIDASENAIKFYGYPFERLTKMNIAEINQLPSEEVKKEMHEASTKNKNVFHFKHALANGEIRDVTVYAAPFSIHGQNLLLSTIFDVTEHLRSQHKLQESEKRFKMLFYQNHSPMLIINPDNGMIEEANESASTFYGYTIQKLITLHISDLNILPHEKIKSELQQSGIQGNNYFQYKHKLADGTIKDVEVFSVRLKLNGHDSIHAIIHDITERKHATKQMEVLNDRMEFAMKANDMAWWEMELPAGNVQFNDNKVRMLGYTKKHFKTYLDFMKLVHPDDYEPTMEAMRQYLAGKKDRYFCEYRIKTKNNKYIWYRDVGKISCKSDGYIKVTGISKDVTEYKSAEQKLIESEEKYRALYSNVPLAYQSLNEDGFILDVNPQWEKALGYKRDEIIGKWFGDFLHDDYISHFKQNFPVFKKRGAIHDVQFRMKKKDGRYIHVSFEGCIGYTPDGKFRQTYCTFKDITIEHAMRKKLKESEERFRKLIENIDEGVILVNPEGTIVQRNDAANNILGISNGDLNGVAVDKFAYTTIHEDGSVFKPEDHPSMITIREKIPQQNVVMGIVRKTGDETWLKINSEPLYLSDHDKPHALVSFTDITSLVEKEKKLLKSNATKDKFFSILAHDLKNPFNAMLGFTELLMHNYDRYDATKHKKYIELLNRSAKSAHLLLENLLIWSRSQRDVILFNPGAYHVHPIIDLIIRQHEPGMLAKSIACSVDVNPSNLKVFADAEMLKTILRNLISNAIKFTPENGKIKIQCTESENATCFSVSDNGKGITKENQKKLFRMDSTFSSEGTKKEKGTGLGLVLCKDFVDRHQGEITVMSKSGKGSTFTFFLPKQY